MQKLHCDTACTKIEFNIRDGRSLAGGFVSGKVCVWDSRVGGAPQLITEKEYSHRERINSLLWIHSKSNAEFYSGSADGQIFWWDVRKFKQPFESLLCDPKRTDSQELDRSYGCSILEFEYTIPTKFMIGTEEGWLFMGNKKGATPTEKLPLKVKCHEGPIRSLERNPVFAKNFLTVGDFRIKVWSEECRDNPIIWTKNHQFDVACATWSRTRCSLYFAGRIDGTLDCWDLLTDLKSPVVSLKV